MKTPPFSDLPASHAIQGSIGQTVHGRAVVMGRGTHQGSAQQEDAAHVFHLKNEGRKTWGKAGLPRQNGDFKQQE